MQPFSRAGHLRVGQVHPSPSVSSPPVSSPPVSSSAGRGDSKMSRGSFLVNQGSLKDTFCNHLKHGFFHQSKGKPPFTSCNVQVYSLHPDRELMPGAGAQATHGLPGLVGADRCKGASVPEVQLSCCGSMVASEHSGCRQLRGFHRCSNASEWSLG